MPELWQRCFYSFLTRVYFARITLLNPECLPAPGQPVLYLGLHRNGAVDGFVYHRVLRHPVFLISTQLRRSWFARLFFQGIAVTRTKDEPHAPELAQEGRARCPQRAGLASESRASVLECASPLALSEGPGPPVPAKANVALGTPHLAASEPERAGANQAALRQCLDHLRSGGQLFVFPEGTSSLGPRHLPFKSGATWLILDYLAAGGPPLEVIPMGIHYECPWAFRAKVEVVLGHPISLDLTPGSPRLQQLKELKRRLQAGLEAVGTNVPTAEYQDQIQRLAYVSTLATPRSYFQSLKALEAGIPAPIQKAAALLDPELRRRCLLTHQGVPLVPMGPVCLYALALVVFGPLVLAALLLNLPPMLAGWYAGRKFPDDRNVISLWKILVGIPAFGLWSAAVVVLLLAERQPRFALAYLLLTWLGLYLYYRVKKLAVAVWNGLRHPSLRPQMLAFRQIVLHSLPE